MIRQKAEESFEMGKFVNLLFYFLLTPLLSFWFYYHLLLNEVVTVTPATVNVEIDTHRQDHTDMQEKAQVLLQAQVHLSRFFFGPDSGGWGGVVWSYLDLHRRRG